MISTVRKFATFIQSQMNSPFALKTSDTLSSMTQKVSNRYKGQLEFLLKSNKMTTIQSLKSKISDITLESLKGKVFASPRALGLGSVTASYLYFKNGSLEDTLAFRCRQAGRSGRMSSIVEAMDRVENSSLNHCDKAKVLQKVLQNAVAVKNYPYITAVIASVAKMKPLTEWERALILQSGLIQAVVKNDKKSIALLMDAILKDPNFCHSVTLEQVLGTVLKKAVDCKNTEIFSDLLAKSSAVLPSNIQDRLSSLGISYASSTA